jgi:phosphonate transport system substrate-binding protein
MRSQLRKMAGRLLTLGLCLAIQAGCSKTQPPPQNAIPPEKTILIGLIPEQNIFKQIERYEPLADYLSGKTGVRINLKILPRYGNIINNFRSMGLDGAFFGSFTYALAHETLGVSVIARPLAPDNTSTYHGLIFVRKDSGIGTIADMKGKRFAFVDKATTAGYLLPLEYFHENGVKDFRNYFRETYFTGTHEDAILDVLSGKADVGAAKNTVFQRMSEKDSRITKELVVLERSPDVPENGLALKKDVEETLRESFRSALLAMHDDPEGKKILERFGAKKFIPTTDRDYDPVYDYAREIHLDLSKYDYVNQ